MIKKGTRYLLLPLLFVSMCVCAGALLFKPVKNINGPSFKLAAVKKNVKKIAEKKRVFAGQITDFFIPEELAPAAIDQAHGIIGIAVHANQDITNLTPTITVTPGSTVTPISGLSNDFTDAPPYTVDEFTMPVHYNVQVFHAGTASGCSNVPTTLSGTSNAPAGTYEWQILDENTHTWSAAPTPNNNLNYPTQPILNNTSLGVRYTFRRAITTLVGTAYDSYTDLTVNPVIPITDNTITQPPDANSIFCVTGDPGTIHGDPVGGGDGNPQYQWQSSVGGNPFADIAGAGTTDKDYAPGIVTATTKFQRVVKSGDCNTPTTSNTVTITVQPALSGGTLVAPSAGIHCASYAPGHIQDTPPTGGDGNYTYSWQSAPAAAGPYTDIPSTDIENYDPGTVTQTTWLRRRVTCTGPCTTPAFTNSIGLFVDPPVGNNILNPLTNNTFCGQGAPGNITGLTPTGGDGTYAYNWQQAVNGGGFTDIQFVDQAQYSPGLVTQTTAYRRGVISGACNTIVYSDPVTVTIQPPLTNYDITPLAPENSLFCASGSPGTINGDLPQGGDGNYTYVWQSSVNGGPMTDIPQTNFQNYDPGVVTQTTVFQRAVISGSCTVRAVSRQVSVQIQPALSNNVITPPPVVSFCQTANEGAITGQQPNGGDGSPSYQWQQSPDNVDVHFANISGQNGADLTPPTSTSTMFYRRVITEATCTTPLISNVIEIHVTQPLDPTKNHITPPLTTTFCTSYDPNTIIGTFGADNPPAGVDAIVYQWLKSTDNGASWVPITVNGNAPDYDPDPITVTTWYMRTVRSGACATPINSVETVKLNIIDSPPNIAIDPAAPICAGETATLSIASPDAALTYNWYDTPTKDNLLSQGVTFKTTPLTANQTFYAEASNGTCSSPQLASVVVTVNPLPGVPVLADAAPTGCEGSPAILKIASPQNDLTYKWYSAATGGSPLFTGPEFTTPGLTGNVTYYAEAGNSSGCVSSSRAAAVITVYPLPVAIAQGATICPGTIATLTSNSPDPDQTINWYDVPTGGIPVGTGSSFTTPLLTSGKSYYAEAVNTISGCVSATRAEAKVQISTPLNSPVVHVIASVAPDVTFAWAPVDGAVAYRVSTDNGSSYTDPSTGPDGTSHTVTGLQIGQRVTIIVRAIGNASCETSTDSNPVTGVTTDPDVDKIFVANAFTPNGDGKNDIVYAHNDNIKSLKFYVYDQWGNMLFQSLSPQKGWDGTYKGKLQPVGVYVYYLEAVMNDGQPVTKKGTITLLR